MGPARPTTVNISSAETRGGSVRPAAALLLSWQLFLLMLLELALAQAQRRRRRIAVSAAVIAMPPGSPIAARLGQGALGQRRTNGEGGTAGRGAATRTREHGSGEYFFGGPAGRDRVAPYFSCAEAGTRVTGGTTLDPVGRRCLASRLLLPRWRGPVASGLLLLMLLPASLSLWPSVSPGWLVCASRSINAVKEWVLAVLQKHASA